MEQSIHIQAATELRSVIQQLVKKLRKESPSSQHLSLTERSTMSQLYQNKIMLPSELAANEKITNQSMSQVLNNLQKMEYITRIPSETDKRKVNISLTEKGEALFIQFRHERDEWFFKAITAACTADEQQLLEKMTVPLRKIVDFK